MRRHRIVGTGLFALDVILDADSRRLGSALGGSSGNVLSILGALGWTATPVTRLGRDSMGQQLHHELKEVGADLRFVDLSPSHRTNVIYQHQLAFSDGDSGTHRFSFVCPSCGEKHRPVVDCGSDLVHKVLAGQSSTDVFYLDRPTREGYDLARSYRASGAMVVFEPSTEGDDPELFSAILKHSHIVKYAEERFQSLSLRLPDSVAFEIQTLGERGLRFRSVFSDSSWQHLAAFRVPHVQDTAGAGDWCTAGLLFSLLQQQHPGQDWRSIQNLKLASALSFGQALSSLNCLTRGARGLLQALDVPEILALADSLCDSQGGARRAVEVDRLNLLGRQLSSFHDQGALRSLPACCHPRG
jgi:sugar/nucleoside kinase (ribokinase family)